MDFLIVWKHEIDNNRLGTQWYLCLTNAYKKNSILNQNELNLKFKILFKKKIKSNQVFFNLMMSKDVYFHPSLKALRVVFHYK